MQSFAKAAFIALAFLAICGFSKQQTPAPSAIQPSDERQAQEALPKSNDAMWQVLGKTKIDTDLKKGTFRATYPHEVKALVGKEITISGFILPLEATEKFIISFFPSGTPTCPFVRLASRTKSLTYGWSSRSPGMRTWSR